MKGRDSRKQTIITAAAAIVGAATTGAIIGISAVTPFAAAKGSEAVQSALAKHKAGMPAAKAAKAELDKLKKEQKQLDKDKKTLEAKKSNARKAQAKKIYEERVAHGYEASYALIEEESAKAVVEDTKGKKKSKKQKKQAPVVMAPKTEKEIAAELAAETAAEVDPNRTASMFNGISF